MKYLLVITSLGEALFGLMLLFFPHIIINLIFDANIGDLDVVISLFVAISLISLAAASWPYFPSYSGMFLYNFLAFLYFSYIAIQGIWVGLLLYPALLLHGFITLLFVWKKRFYRP